MLFSGLWLVEQFLCICMQTIDQMELKCGGTTHYEGPPAWQISGHAALHSHNFLAFD